MKKCTGDSALRTTEAGERRRHHDDVLHGALHLVDRAEVAQHPHAEILRRERVSGVLLGRFGVFGIAREIEQADRQALIVQPVEDGDRVERVGADDLPPSGKAPLNSFPAGTTTTLDWSGKPNSGVRARMAPPSSAFRLMPVQAKPGVVASHEGGAESGDRDSTEHG
jgi:hypothetical protein